MKETIIQFGEGNFLRGFYDYFLDEMNKQGLYEGKAVVIQPRAGGKCALLQAQDCRYNLYLRGIENGETVSRHSLIESISRCIDPYKNFGDFIALAENPDMRFVVSNTTEAGIAFDESCSFSDTPCLSFPGKVTQLLFERFEKGLKGFAFLPCELIDNNGDELKSCVIKYARHWGLSEEFINWVNEENVFLNTLVDRIVTGYPDDEAAKAHPEDKFLDAAEIFHLWVLDGDFENELPLKKAGFNVIWTDDVKPFKKTKVRILNGAHTSLVAGCLLSGIESVGEAMKDDTTSAFLKACMEKEILPTIGETKENLEFARAVSDRFSNPFIFHRWRAIALNSISKFSVRVLPTLMEYKGKYGSAPKGLTLSLAMLLYFYKNDAPEDNADIISFIKVNSIEDILKNDGLWQADISALTDEVKTYYDKISEIGAKEAMKWILSE